VSEEKLESNATRSPSWANIGGNTIYRRTKLTRSMYLALPPARNVKSSSITPLFDSRKPMRCITACSFNVAVAADVQGLKHPSQRTLSATISSSALEGVSFNGDYAGNNLYEVWATGFSPIRKESQLRVQSEELRKYKQKFFWYHVRNWLSPEKQRESPQ
jgi:hypothetical protein